jgi:hypothetical protein
MYNFTGKNPARLLSMKRKSAENVFRRMTTTTAALVILLFLSLASHAQRNIFAVDIFKLMQLKISARYERVVPRQSSFGANATVYFYNSVNVYRPFIVWDEGKYGGVRLDPYFRFYFQPFAPHGFYLQPKVTAGWFNSDLEYRYYYTAEQFDSFTVQDDFFSVGAGVAFGHQWLIEDKFPLEVSAGLQYAFMLTDRFKTNGGKTYERNDNIYLPGTGSWYIAGPGSILEVAIRFGIIF